MSESKNLISGKQIALIAGAMLFGVIFANARLYAEHGRLETHHYIATGITVLFCVILVVVMRRFANRRDRR